MRTLLRYLTYTAALCMGLASAEAARLQVGSATATPGGTVTLSLNWAAEGASVSTMQLDVLLPAPLTYVSCAAGPAANGAGKEVTASPVTGGVRLVVFGLNQTTILDGVLATLTLRVAENAAPGTVPVGLGNVTAAGPDARSVAVTQVGGSVTVQGAGGTPQLRLGSASGQCGETVTLPLTLVTNGGSVASLQVDLGFAAPLTFSAVAAGTAAEAAGKSVSGIATAGGARIVVVGLNQNAIGDGIVATVTLGIGSAATAGTYPVTLSGVVAADPNAQPVTVTTQNGAVTATCGVTCTHRYWIEIAAHLPGTFGSQWRTDLVARNMSTSRADLELKLHTATRTTSKLVAVEASAQGIFENVVGLMGVQDKGALEVCSSQPLALLSRMYNQATSGTFGQLVDGYTSADGLSQGQAAWLYGLRQLEGSYRTNISVTNTGTAAANVKVTLYRSDGTRLGDFTLHVAGGQVVQDLEPFKTRVGQPNLGWGFAKVEVVSGSGLLTSASVIDSRTNDPTTIPMKR